MKTTGEWYRENPEKYEARKRQIKARQVQIRKRVQEYRKDKPCIYCGFDNYRAIDFHHRNPDEKAVEPARLYLKGWSWGKILAELDKCDPVCRNCHAILHYNDKRV